MKLISYNVNGIRAAMRKGLVEWLSEEQPDVLCLQEVKATPDQVELQEFKDLGYEHIYWFAAQKKGYSGVAVFSKVPAVSWQQGMDMAPYDEEGRVIRVEFEHFTLINAYFPSGTSGDERQAFKYQFLDDFRGYIGKLRQEAQKLVICGDFNICHTSIDIHNPQRNKNTSGFQPAERQWVSDFMEGEQFRDAFRHFVKEPHRYSWWTYRAGARKKNLGWRIDYFMVSEEASHRMTSCDMLDQVVHSDHCPVVLSLSTSQN